jgi:glycosyltransferase involved in cell wall biosynthesis
LSLIIKIIIPAFNEENGIGEVIREIPKGLIAEIVVVNNASTDNTEIIAKEAGATVLREPIPGYGRACLKGIDYISQSKPFPDIVVFLDADHSDYPEEMVELIKPTVDGNADLVIGSRALGQKGTGIDDAPTNIWKLVSHAIIEIIVRGTVYRFGAVPRHSF